MRSRSVAPNPVLSNIRYFRDEFEAHIRDKHCEAGVCSSMFTARCSNACPASVNVPGFVSLIGEKRFDEALRLHRERNPLASICGRVCFHPCESKCARGGLDDPVAIRALKRFMTEQEIEPNCPRLSRTRRTPSGRSPSSAAARPASPVRTSWPALDTSRSSSRRAYGRWHARPGHPLLPPSA